MYKALIIGCGNIGALYDFDSDQITTHAKAFFMNPSFSVTLYDKDEALLKKVTEKYKCDSIQTTDTNTLTQFDCISICTPTSTHLFYLELALNAKTKVIICEKPVSNSLADLLKAKDIASNTKSNILVNYFRRFQPAYEELKDKIHSLLKNEKLTNVSIRYQRGFLNNCSHAFDLIEFILNSKIELNDINKTNSITDHFNDDPTLSLQANWQGINFNVLGLSNVKFSLFEIELYFTYHKISIYNSGQNIAISSSEMPSKVLQPLKPAILKENCIKDHMANVIEHALGILKGDIKEDNFLGSVDLNERMITYKNNTYGAPSN